MGENSAVGVECARCDGRGWTGANSLDMLREPCDDCGGAGVRRMPSSAQDPSVSRHRPAIETPMPSHQNTNAEPDSAPPEPEGAS